MEQPTIVLTMTRAEFDKLSTAWFVEQQIAGPCTCDTCESKAQRSYMSSECSSNVKPLDGSVEATSGSHNTADHCIAFLSWSSDHDFCVMAERANEGL